MFTIVHQQSWLKKVIIYWKMPEVTSQLMGISEDRRAIEGHKKRTEENKNKI